MFIAAPYVGYHTPTKFGVDIIWPFIWNLCYIMLSSPSLYLRTQAITIQKYRISNRNVSVWPRKAKMALTTAQTHTHTHTHIDVALVLKNLKIWR